MTLPIETCIRRTPCIAFPEAVRLIQVSRYINAAVPPAGAGETGDNNRAILQFHIQRQKNICIFGNYHLLDLQVLSPLLSASSITMFCYVPQKPPRATFCHFCAHLCLFLLDSTWNLLRDTLKKKKKKLSSSAGSLFLVPFFSPASAGGSTAKTTVPQTRTIEPAHRPVYRLSRDSRYL